MKPFEAQQRRVKIKNLIHISIQLSEMHGTGKVKYRVWAPHSEQHYTIPFKSF